MGALSKFFFSPIYKLISLYFSKFLPETLKFIILSLIMLYSSYRRETSRIVYTAGINKNSSKFVYNRKLLTQAPPHTTAFDSPECSICLSEYQDGDVARRLRCNHTFHKKCSDKWFQGSLQGTCPICRTWLLPEGIVEERRRLEKEHQSVKGNVEEKIALILLPTVNIWTYNSGFFSDYTDEIY